MAMPRRWPRGYYTYIFYEGDVPRWVGAGKGSRARPQRFPQLRQVLVVLYEQPDREAAFDLEQKLIRQFGRADLGTGPLINRTFGLGSCGRVWTDEQRFSAGAAQSARVWTDEQRAAAAVRMRGNKNLLGFRHSEETKKVIGKKASGRRLSISPEGAAHRSVAVAASNRRRRGKPLNLSEEERRARSERMRKMRAKENL